MKTNHVCVCERVCVWKGIEHKETFSSHSNCKWEGQSSAERREREGGWTATTFACAAIIHPLKGISMRQYETKKGGSRRDKVKSEIEDV